MPRPARPAPQTLVAQRLQSWWLLMPLLLWAVLVITLYAVSYNLVQVGSSHS